MKYAIDILERELIIENRQIDEEEDDLIGAVASQRKTNSIKSAIKHLKYLLSVHDELKLIS
jgi:hypothetical protein